MSDVTATLAQQAYTIETLEESIAQLSLQLEDAGWARIGDDGREFGPDSRRRIVELARTLAIKNPIVKRGITVQVDYVWGQGATIRAADPDINAAIQAFLDDQKNQDELTSHLAREQKERELQTDGNIFFALFANRLTGAVRVRTIPVGEVIEIVTNPEDSKDPWYYRREWTQTSISVRTGAPESTTRIAYYPDWRYTPRSKPRTIGAHPVMWDTPIYHVKVGGFSDWRFGCSEIYAAIDWARAYKEFLEDWATISRALARYAWKMSTKGGRRAIDAAKAKIGTTLGTDSTGLYPERNPPAVAGATWIGGEQADMEPFKTAGAQASMEDGRRMLLMVAAAQNLPETFYGDVSVGTLATATSLDRPTELRMRARQTLWASVYRALLDYALLWAVKAPQGALRGKGRIERTTEAGEIVEAVIWADDPAIAIEFPPIVASNRKDDVATVASAAPFLDDQTTLKLLLTALGVDDVDGVMAEITKARAEQAPPTDPNA